MAPGLIIWMKGLGSADSNKNKSNTAPSTTSSIFYGTSITEPKR